MTFQALFWLRKNACSGDQLLHYFAVNNGGTLTTPAAQIGHFEVVEAEQVEHRRMDVIGVDARADRTQADFVRRAMVVAGLGAAARQPLRIAPRIVVAAVAGLAVGGASEFRRP